MYNNDGSKAGPYQSKHAPTDGTVTFNQCTLDEQETLRGFLTILSRQLSQLEVKKAELLMLSDPFKFFELYQ